MTQAPAPPPRRFSKDDADILRGILYEAARWPTLWHHAPLFDRARVFLTEQFSATTKPPEADAVDRSRSYPHAVQALTPKASR